MLTEHLEVGKSGSGHAMKTLNNYVSVGSIIALCDSLVVGQKFGLDPGTMVDVLNVGTGRNFSTAYSMRDEVCTPFSAFSSFFGRVRSRGNRNAEWMPGIDKKVSERISA